MCVVRGPSFLFTTTYQIFNANLINTIGINYNLSPAECNTNFEMVIKRPLSPQFRNVMSLIIDKCFVRIAQQCRSPLALFFEQSDNQLGLPKDQFRQIGIGY